MTIQSGPRSDAVRASIGRGAVPAAAAAGTFLLLAGCGSGGTQTAAGQAGRAATASQQVMIAGNSSLRFAPMEIRLRTGTVRITLTDSGAYPHNLVIPALGVTSPTVTGTPGGARASFTVTFRHPGSYRFHCQYHASAGMTGVFVVS